ncbi:MAG: DNA repair protein RecN [Oscillospiraceae bacterium]|nr:DNA repair protein RecN [Oscillospiraceae bacterium]
MLTQLYIHNIAVIHKASISFTGGFNVFTGETGAGKTVLVSAIDMVLGERTSRDIIRSGEDKALVSALFEGVSPKASEILERQGYPGSDGSVLITREITAAGKNNCRINGMPATVGILREIASALISIHGQRDSGRLLSPEQHIALIDAFGGLGGLFAEYRESYGNYRRIKSELLGLAMDDAQKARRIDMLTFQVQEIEAAQLDVDEENTLVSRRKAIRNSGRIREGLAGGYAAITGDDDSPGISELFGQLADGVSEAARFLGQMEPLSLRLEEIGYEIEEAGAEIRRAIDELEFDRHELDDIESRLDIIYNLKKKYGANIPAVLAFCQNAAEELEGLLGSEAKAQRLEQAAAAAESEATRLAAELSEKRLAASEAFITAVEGELAYLDMPDVKLSVSCRRTDLGAGGWDAIEFYVTTNIGEPPGPLSKIASGGEIARMMLAIKNVLADRDGVDTMIFDEVDSGVSGRAAGKIGAKLRQASQGRQLICVTHLAQVAACADSHLYIYKEVEGDRAFTKVEALSGEGVFRELARITSGDLITEAAIENARALWEFGHSNQ